MNSFTKSDNILIIDEVFDYMDDANLVAAQHYVNLFVKTLHDEGKNIYPIILTHINPSYFRTFAFKDMKVYYLLPLQYPHASDNMMKLVRKRDDLEKTDKPRSDLISNPIFTPTKVHSPCLRWMAFQSGGFCDLQIFIFRNGASL